MQGRFLRQILLRDESVCLLASLGITNEHQKIILTETADFQVRYIKNHTIGVQIVVKR
jgi:hypothetical protein